MSKQVVATKGNLMAAKRSLLQAKIGYELMDRKRNILIREMVSLTEKAKELTESLEDTFADAYKALRNANILNGVITDKAEEMPVDETIELSFRSVMGIEIPEVKGGNAKTSLCYRLSDTCLLYTSPSPRDRG